MKSSWGKPRRKPRDEERKIIIGLVLNILVTKSLKNHCYETDDKIFQQMINGIIGPDLMRALSNNYIQRWNDKFLKLCMEISENSENINIEPDVFETFVDDNKNIVKEKPPGVEVILEENIKTSKL